MAKRFHQRHSVDYHDTFSPVVKPETVHLVLILAMSHSWGIHPLDFNNAFLPGSLTEDVYIIQPPGFIDSDRPSFVCKLQKALYGLKKAPRAWYTKLCAFLLQSGFTNSLADTSFFSSVRHIYLSTYLCTLTTSSLQVAMVTILSGLLISSRRGSR